MGKLRSPVLGFNHNVRHGGRGFHVQTEDSGVQNPHIDTHLFHEGVIFASKRMDYDPDADVEIVKSLMQAQHKAVMRELKNGVYEDKIALYLGKGDGAPARRAASGSEEAVPIEVPSLSDQTPREALASAAADERTEVTLQPPVEEAGEAEPARPPRPPVHVEEPASSPYAQIQVSPDPQEAIVSGVLDTRESEDRLHVEDVDDVDAEINGLLSRLKEDTLDQPLPTPEPEKAGTWIVSRTGQKERPFEKTGPVAIPVPIKDEDGGRRMLPPLPPARLPEVQPPPPGSARGRRGVVPPGPGAGGGRVRRPTPPPTDVSGIPPGKPPSGEYGTVRPGTGRASGQMDAVRAPPAPGPPVASKPPSHPQARPAAPPPRSPGSPQPMPGAGARPSPGPPRVPSAGPAPMPATTLSGPPAAQRSPPRPGSSQVAPPVPPLRAPGTPPGVPQTPAPMVPRAPVHTAPMRSQTVVPPGAAGSPRAPGVPPVRPAPAAARPAPARRQPVAEGVVVARPAVVIGAPPTVIGGPSPSGEPAVPRRVHGREPTPPPLQPESIFGQDLISEKSLDEVIMAYLSEDANED